MRVVFAILGIALALAAPGCGGDDAATGSGETNADSTRAEAEPTTGSGLDPALNDHKYFGPPIVLDRDDPRFATVTGKGRHPKPVIHPEDRPPPKRFVVRDIEVGSGPLAQPGDKVAVSYIGVAYETGKVQFETWAPLEPPLVIRLGLNGNSWDWEEGIVGMRVGGRREMIIPATPSPNSDPLDYIFDLVRVEPALEMPSGG